MSTEQKYFTPSINDIYIGYEYECKTQDGVRHTKEYMDTLPWHKRVIKSVDDIPYFERTLVGRMVTQDGIQCIRVPYLNKEQIEAEGWEMYSKSVDLWFKFKESPITHTHIQELYGYKPYNLFLNYGMHDQKLKIKCDFNGGQDFDGSDTLFEGFCKDINTLRSICKLIGIW